jgi:hypothetical protein
MKNLIIDRRRPNVVRLIRKDISVVLDRVVLDQTERNAISAEERYVGYLVFQHNEQEFYELKDGIENEHWVVKEWGGSDKHLKYYVSNKTTETISHNLQKKPSIQIHDEEGNKVITDYKHIDLNNTQITWLEPFSGFVTFN